MKINRVGQAEGSISNIPVIAHLERVMSALGYKNNRLCIHGETAYAFLKNRHTSNYWISFEGIPEDVFPAIFHMLGYRKLTRTVFVHQEYPYVPGMFLARPATEHMIDGITGLKGRLSFDTLSVTSEGKIFCGDDFPYNPDKAVDLYVSEPTLDPCNIRLFRFQEELGGNLTISARAYLNNMKKDFLGFNTRYWQYEMVNIMASPYAHKIIRNMIYEDFLDNMMVPYHTNIWKAAKNTPQHKSTSADVVNHTLRTLKYCTSDIVVRFAALFHDIGKVITYQQHKNFRHHEKVSADITEQTLTKWGFDPYFIRQVCSCIYNHMLVGGIQRKGKYTKQDLHNLLTKCPTVGEAVKAIDLAIADKASTHNQADFLLPLIQMRDELL